MLVRHCILSLLLLLSIQSQHSVVAFSSSRTTRTKNLIAFSPVGLSGRNPTFTLSNSADPVAAEEAEITTQDKKGKTIAVGTVVRVAAENLKAYQVPAKGHGKFNENKEFVPAPADGGRASKNLVLPVGLRGVVTKVYDSDALSANFPIQVRFTPGEHTDEGYDPPMPFLMHFDAGEVECV